MDPVTWAGIGTLASSAAAPAAGAAALGTAVDTAIAAAPAVFGTTAAVSSGVDLAIAGAPAIFGTSAALATGDTVAAGATGLNFARMFNIGSTIFNSASNLIGGIAQSKEKKSEAAQLDLAAKERVAAATREMAIEGRNMDLAISKARNNAAAGDGALDPSVVNILGDLEKQGATNEANTLDTANSEAHAMQAQAADDRFMAKQSLIGGGIGAVTSLFSGLNKSMSSKYGYDNSTVSYA